MIIYITDQGFYLGEKGWFDKWFMYEESLGMPMVMRYPAAIKKGTVVEALTQNIDFAETLLDFAQAEIPDDMQGKSLKPLLTENTKDNDFRDAIYYHYYDYPALHMVKKMYDVRTKRYKLIHIYDDIDEWEMYDLQKDPQELDNLINNAQYSDVKGKLHKKLDSLQTVYKVTETEFEQAPKDRVDKAYKQFKHLRGSIGASYNPNTNTDKKSSS